MTQLRNKVSLIGTISKIFATSDETIQLSLLVKEETTSNIFQISMVERLAERALASLTPGTTVIIEGRLLNFHHASKPPMTSIYATEFLILSKGLTKEPDPKIEKQKLVDQVIEQMRIDFSSGDTTAIDELLMRVPDNLLRGYLPEKV